MTYLLILLTTLFADANQHYADGQYDQAIQLYLQCPQSSEVYYNLGNAYFKQGELAQAILSYERCLRINPRHKDAQFNLEFARTQIIDNIEDNQAFFISSWMKIVRNSLHEGVWHWISIVAFVIMLVSLLLFALNLSISELHQTAIRKMFFHLSWIMFLLTIIGGLNASSLHKRDTIRSEAIITQGVLNAKSSPDQSGTDLFTLHEGTKVEIIETLTNWANIRVGNNQGWVQINHLERI